MLNTAEPLEFPMFEVPVNPRVAKYVEMMDEMDDILAELTDEEFYAAHNEIQKIAALLPCDRDQALREMFRVKVDCLPAVGAVHGKFGCTMNGDVPPPRAED